MNNFISLLILFSFSFLTQSYSQDNFDEIIILNLDDPCLDGILISHVENKIKIIKENSSCDEIKNWKISNGSISYLGNCEYLIIPKSKKTLDSFYLTNKNDSLQFLILFPTINSICISNFGCSHKNPKKKLGLDIQTDHPDLIFSEVRFDYEFYKNAKLILKGKSNSLQITLNQKLININFQKGDFFLLKNIYLKSDRGFEMEIDLLKNDFTHHIFH